jgi:DNA modification methylase
MITLYNADCEGQLRAMPSVHCIFADPPDNIALDYDEYKDRKPDHEYLADMMRWLDTATQKASTVWWSFNARWTIEMGVIAQAIKSKWGGQLEAKTMVQVFTFGQHNPHDFGNNHRPLWRFQHASGQRNMDAIRVPSWRQLNGDKRADPRGRVPGDVFETNETGAAYAAVGSWLSAALDDPTVCDEMKRDIEAWFNTWPGDVFDYPRVVGTGKQRRKWHPTQLNEDLVERAIVSATQPGEVVCDMFAGTGTTLRVAERVGRHAIGIEFSLDYCRRIAEEMKLTEVRDGIWQRT